MKLTHVPLKLSRIISAIVMGYGLWIMDTICKFMIHARHPYTQLCSCETIKTISKMLLFVQQNSNERKAKNNKNYWLDVCFGERRIVCISVIIEWKRKRLSIDLNFWMSQLCRAAIHIATVLLCCELEFENDDKLF